MFSSDDDNQGLVLGVVFGVIALVVALVIGLAIHSRHPAKVAAAAPAAPVAVLAVAGDGPSIRVAEGLVVFYFASGKAELAEGASQALGNVAAAVSGGKMAVVSGFHDASGDPAVNAELAKQGQTGSRPAGATTPVPRLGTPQDVADAVAFLVSERSAYTTGSVVPVDGGGTSTV